MTGEVGVWWFRPAPGTTNIGDELGPAILERLGYRVRRVPLEQADLIASGSVLELAEQKARPGATVWGAGFLIPTRRLTKSLHVAAARGALAARQAGTPDAVLGDPGLLVPLLWGQPWKPTHRLGVVAHYADNTNYRDWADTVIDPTRPVDEVIGQILSCHTIASSSLHGLIVAAAYGIPTMRLEHPKVIGGHHKWIDYLSALDAPLDVVQKRLLGALDG